MSWIKKIDLLADAGRSTRSEQIEPDSMCGTEARKAADGTRST